MSLSSYLDTYKKILAFGGSAATIPLFASFLSLQPPWPPAIGPVSTAAVLVAALVAWEWTREASVPGRRRLILTSAAATAVGLLLYLYLYSEFVDTIPHSSMRVVRGYECTADAKLVYRSACPNLPTDALQGAEWESTDLWTRASVTNVRIGLATAWLAFTFGLAFVVGGIVAGRER